MAGFTPNLITNLRIGHVARAAAAAVAEVAAAADRATEVGIAIDLAAVALRACDRLPPWLCSRHVHGRSRPHAGSAFPAWRAVVAIALGDRLPAARFFALIVIVEERAGGAGDLDA